MNNNVPGTRPAPATPASDPTLPPAPSAPLVPGIGGPRSAATRRAILEAARLSFATKGYEQTTIRAVATAAEVDPAMVMRYFQSKAGLFAAAATADVTPPDLSTVAPAERGELMVRSFVARWEYPTRDDTLILLLRTAVTSEAVAAQVQATVRQLVTTPIAALPEFDDEQAAERGGFVSAQLLGLALCRYILRLEPLASLPTDAAVAAVAQTVQPYLAMGVPALPGQPPSTAPPASAARPAPPAQPIPPAQPAPRLRRVRRWFWRRRH
jgi:AcrR family transcriptional regulator